MLGLPREDYKQFQRWSIAILSFLSKQEEAIAASQEVKEYVAKILEDRRREPCEDLISDLANAELDGERLSDEEIFSFVRLLLPAGVETTYRSTGNLLLTLLSNPDQLDAVRSDRSLMPQTIEESLRFETPLLNITRLATKDTEIDGVPIPAGSTVMLMLVTLGDSRWAYRHTAPFATQPLLRESPSARKRATASEVMGRLRLVEGAPHVLASPSARSRARGAAVSALIAPLGDLAAEGGHRESKASHGRTELTIRTDARRFGPN